MNDRPAVAGLIRPAKHNRNLQYVAKRVGPDGQVSETYYEVDEKLTFVKPVADRTDEVKEIAKVGPPGAVNKASVIVTDKGRHPGLPKGDACYDRPFAAGWPHGIRECVSERYLMNIHGTFYEKPHEDGVWKVEPDLAATGRSSISAHGGGCWSSAAPKPDARPDRMLPQPPTVPGLWCGGIDDLWKFGKPVGRGGPWCHTAVTTGPALRAVPDERLRPQTG